MLYQASLPVMVSSMLLSTLLFVASAMASGGNGPWRESMSVTENPNSINVTEYYHLAHALYEEIIKVRKRMRFEKQWAIDEISSEKLALSKLATAALGALRFVRKSVRFLTHFQIPQENDSTDPELNREVYLIFLHDPELEFHWDSDITSNPQFQHVKTITESTTCHQDVYQVVGRPGGVFPLSITVLNIQKSNTFGMEWTSSLEYSDRKPLKAQLVKLIDSEVEVTDLSGSLEAPKNFLKLGPLVPSLPVSAFEKFVNMDRRKAEYSLETYFKATKKLNRFVLSSTVPVIAAIHVVEHNTRSVHTLVAREGLASKLNVTLTPDKYYKIDLTGALPFEDVTNFSLQASSPENEFLSSYVSLEVPPVEVPPVEVPPVEKPTSKLELPQEMDSFTRDQYSRFLTGKPLRRAQNEAFLAIAQGDLYAAVKQYDYERYREYK